MVKNNFVNLLVSYRAPGKPSSKAHLERDNLRSAVFWRGAAAECLALVLFIPLGPGASVGWTGGNTPSNLLIAFSNGLAIATLIQCFGHVSGAHFNPAVTISLALVRQVSIVKAVVYIAAQCVGATGGAAILRIISPVDKRSFIGMTRINYAEDVSLWQGFALELFITFHLVLMVFATIDSDRKDLRGSPAVAIGFTVATGLMYGIPYTGASMNPARSFGPALVNWVWTDQWVYWAAPIGAGILATLVYQCLFAQKALILRETSCRRTTGGESAPNVGHSEVIDEVTSV
ncbi:aquaporin AQPAe.a-like [Diadema setosum]|uniref:aquaporin AQPAe.a-like n=1 Tax=Diadema setosum TaxID=31175 RepID=UPI003B3B082D